MISYQIGSLLLTIIQLSTVIQTSPLDLLIDYIEDNGSNSNDYNYDYDLHYDQRQNGTENYRLHMDGLMIGLPAPSSDNSETLDVLGAIASNYLFDMNGDEDSNMNDSEHINLSDPIIHYDTPMPKNETTNSEVGTDNETEKEVIKKSEAKDENKTEMATEATTKVSDRSMPNDDKLRVIPLSTVKRDFKQSDVRKQKRTNRFKLRLSSLIDLIKRSRRN